jgi:hypothetical protein
MALAGEYRTGTGATPEKACWDYNRQANRLADTNNTCYESCKPAKVVPKGTVYTYRNSIPNHERSCRKNKRYDRDPISTEEFLRRYPRPGTSAEAEVDETPVRGINTVDFKKHYPAPDRAVLTIVNNTSKVGVTSYSVSVRDSRYSFPARVIEEGQVTLKPQQSWSKEFLQWGAADWNVVTR